MELILELLCSLITCADGPHEGTDLVLEATSLLLLRVQILDLVLGLLDHNFQVVVLVLDFC